MSKLRCIISLLSTNNYVVITDSINDGHVEPLAANEFSEQLYQVAQQVDSLAREVNLAHSSRKDISND